jgi:dihydroorotase-like cyclic amidohydrolase
LPAVAVSGTKAQGASGGVTITISSPFVAGEATLPAGSFTVTQDPDDSSVVDVANTAGTHQVLMLVEAVESEQPRAKSEVIFSKYGNTLVMKQIWVAGLNTGYVVITSHAEKKAVKTGKAVKLSLAADTKQAAAIPKRIPCTTRSLVILAVSLTLQGSLA